ncbi:hypothetical protein DACRYDRAFT_91769 [Dacryopinax primogenitus]|uniref:Uncharacterized protein n=1 Tax=Dacryopinax primogenitus (strain DJM 731) TaxID=1858805 RepID=M5FNB0_DACPD|nr:uncharacterized protein DACRYDRAFT_91769 [Dacryopinax primogenitus]EJT97130.1 hypothetical protein DACRYDRAFT_91769 [Dacryopinax primogenitus]
MGSQIRRYGPALGFWTFLFECLNKVLKTIETNSHKGGESNALAGQNQDLLVCMLSIELEKHNQDLAWVGTLTALAVKAQDVVNQQADLGQCLPAGVGKCMPLDNWLQEELVSRYARYHPDLDIRPLHDYSAGPDTLWLSNKATFFSELCMEGKHIIKCVEEKFNKSDMLVVRLQCGTQWVGELCDVFQHVQPGLSGMQTFVLIAWLVPLQATPQHASLYDNLKELEVHFWQHNCYQTFDNDFGIQPLLLACDLCRFAAHCMLEVKGQLMWITTGLSKNGHYL